VRAALLFGREDLRVLDVPDPDAGPGEVVVRVEAATTCGTDVKMWRRGHPILPPDPARFGHETAGMREDTGELVLVADSVACGRCRACAAGRPQICRQPRWVLGGFAERIAAPEAALHAVPDGLEPAAAAMAALLAAAVHALDRAPDRRVAPDAGVLGGGPMGQMLAALLVAEGRTVTLADRHAERRAQAQAAGATSAEMLAALLVAEGRTVLLADRHAERRAQAEAAGATSAEALADHDVVFEAVGRPDAWRAAVQACAPGGCVVFVGGCKAGTDASLPTRPLHYEELDLRGAFHHAPEEVDCALALLAAGTLDWRALAAGPIGLDDLQQALGAGNQGPARKWVVIP
jgi:L-iditol 2-dehydrogenase